MTLAEQLTGFLHVPGTPVSDVELDALQAGCAGCSPPWGMPATCRRNARPGRSAIVWIRPRCSKVLTELFDEAGTAPWNASGSRR